jgi:hypothetical protein
MPGGEFIEERGTSMPRGLGDSDTIVQECHGEGHLRGNRGITVDTVELKGDLMRRSPPEAETGMPT